MTCFSSPRTDSKERERIGAVPEKTRETFRRRDATLKWPLFLSLSLVPFRTKAWQSSRSRNNDCHVHPPYEPLARVKPAEWPQGRSIGRDVTGATRSNVVYNGGGQRKQNTRPVRDPRKTRGGEAKRPCLCLLRVYCERSV